MHSTHLAQISAYKINCKPDAFQQNQSSVYTILSKDYITLSLSIHITLILRKFKYVTNSVIQ